MLRPAALKSDQPLTWSAGRGTDVWALFQACATGDLPTVQALVAKDRSLARAHYDYRKPLYFAVRENHVDVARFLLEHDTNPMDLWVDDDPIEIARDRGYAAMERMLLDTLETKFNASAKGEPVALALREHDLKKMRALLDAEPDLLSKGDKRSNQPIHWATMTRQLEAIDELLRRGADINAADGRRPADSCDQRRLLLSRLARRPAPLVRDARQVMEHLKARGAVIDLPTACHTGDIARVRELLRQDPGLANKVGVHEGYYLGAGAPLSNAAAVGRMDIVQLLLDHGADPNLPEEQFAPKGKALYRPSTTGTTTSRSSCSSAGHFRIQPRRELPVAHSGCRGNGGQTNAWRSCCFRTAPDPSRRVPMRTGPRASTTGCASRRSTVPRERAT